MITEYLLNLVFNLVEGVLSNLPQWDFDIDITFFTTAIDLMRVAFYLLPMGTITLMISLVVFFQGFRLIISLLKTIWEILPLV